MRIDMAGQALDETSTTARDAKPALRRGRMAFVPRRARGEARASRFVMLMKLLLPAAALAIIGLLLLWPSLLPGRSKFQIGTTRITTSDIDGLRMENPRYVGVDEESRPFQVSAAVATQDRNDGDVVRLNALKADLLASGQSWVALEAAEGVYHKTEQTIDLSGGVTMFHDQGYEMRSTTAKVDLKTGGITSDEPVQGQGMAGAVQGQGLRMYDRGTRVVFTGKSRVVLYPKQIDRPR